MKTVTLNARHLLCPLPVIRLQQQVAELAAESRIEIICTDPGALQDIPAWCRIHGHRLLAVHEEEGELTLWVEVGNSGTPA